MLSWVHVNCVHVCTYDDDRGQGKGMRKFSPGEKFWGEDWLASVYHAGYNLLALYPLTLSYDPPINARADAAVAHVVVNRA